MVYKKKKKKLTLDEYENEDSPDAQEVGPVRGHIPRQLWRLHYSLLSAAAAEA